MPWFEGDGLSICVQELERLVPAECTPAPLDPLTIPEDVGFPAIRIAGDGRIMEEVGILGIFNVHDDNVVECQLLIIAPVDQRDHRHVVVFIDLFDPAQVLARGGIVAPFGAVAGVIIDGYEAGVFPTRRGMRIESQAIQVVAGTIIHFAADRPVGDLGSVGHHPVFLF